MLGGDPNSASHPHPTLTKQELHPLSHLPRLLMSLFTVQPFPVWPPCHRLARLSLETLLLDSWVERISLYQTPLSHQKTKNLSDSPSSSEQKGHCDIPHSLLTGLRLYTAVSKGRHFWRFFFFSLFITVLSVLLWFLSPFSLPLPLQPWLYFRGLQQSL